MKKFSLSLVFFLACLIIVSPTLAASYRIKNNGNRSRNTISSRSSHTTRVTQSNLDTYSNYVTTYSHTGTNDSNNNTNGSITVKTGTSTTSIHISNTGGYNYYSGSDCCDDCPNEPDDCEPESGWVNQSIDPNQGTLKNGNPITDPQRTDPNAALGNTEDFFSLGKNGYSTFKFSNPVLDISGDDIFFYEVTNDRDTYPEEKASIEVSSNGTDWYSVGTISNKDNGTGESGVDISVTGLDQVEYVRITDMTDFSLHEDQADGYDLRAILAQAIACE